MHATTKCDILLSHLVAIAVFASSGFEPLGKKSRARFGHFFGMGWRVRARVRVSVWVYVCICVGVFVGKKGNLQSVTKSKFGDQSIKIIKYSTYDKKVELMHHAVDMHTAGLYFQHTQ